MKIVYSVKSLQLKNKQQKNPNLILTITITPHNVNCYRNQTILCLHTKNRLKTLVHTHFILDFALPKKHTQIYFNPHCLKNTLVSLFSKLKSLFFTLKTLFFNTENSFFHTIFFFIFRQLFPQYRHKDTIMQYLLALSCISCIFRF